MMDNRKATVIYIPPHHRKIRNYHYSPLILKSIMGLFAVILLTFIAWQISLQLQAGREILQLQEQLVTQLSNHEQAMQEKEGTIANLQANVYDLSQAAKQMEAQLQQLHRMERELREMINEADINLELSRSQHSEQQAGLEQAGLGGKFSPITNEQFEQLAMETSSAFTEIQHEYLHLNEQLQQAHADLIIIHTINRHTPSIWPTASTAISSSFGIRKDPFTRRLSFHNGIDITDQHKAPVFVTADGIVSETGYNSVQGNYVHIDHQFGFETFYLHLNEVLVAENEQVVKGQQIGKMGSTGRSTGTHLHYEVTQLGQPEDPLDYIK